VEIQDSALVLLSGEVWSQLSVYENPQNNRLIILIHEFPLRDMKVGVWCAMSAVSIAGLLFFSGSATQRRLWPPRLTRFLDHTQRSATVGRTPLDE
jgi:hypothetical protein